MRIHTQSVQSQNLSNGSKRKVQRPKFKVQNAFNIVMVERTPTTQVVRNLQEMSNIKIESTPKGKKRKERKGKRGGTRGGRGGFKTHFANISRVELAGTARTVPG